MEPVARCGTKPCDTVDAAVDGRTGRSFHCSRERRSTGPVRCDAAGAVVRSTPRSRWARTGRDAAHDRRRGCSGRRSVQRCNSGRSVRQARRIRRRANRPADPPGDTHADRRPSWPESVRRRGGGSSVGGLVGLDDARRDAAAVADLVTVLACPVADRAACSRSTRLDRAAPGRPPPLAACATGPRRRAPRREPRNRRRASRISLAFLSPGRSRTTCRRGRNVTVSSAVGSVEVVVRMTLNLARHAVPSEESTDLIAVGTESHRCRHYCHALQRRHPTVIAPLDVSTASTAIRRSTSAHCATESGRTTL